MIRGVSGNKGNSLRMTEADMKLLLASKQLAQKGVTTSQQQSVTQLLQGIQSGQVISYFFLLICDQNFSGLNTVDLISGNLDIIDPV